MDENQKKTLLKWRARCKRSQIAHNYTAIIYRRFHFAVGGFLILLTTTASILTFWTPQAGSEWVPKAIAIVAALMAAFHTFMKFSEHAEMHRSCARRYGEVKKRN